MPRYELDQFATVTTRGDLSFSPDGKWITFVSNVSSQFNVWKQPVSAGPDNYPLLPVQLTATLEQSMLRAIWSPDGKRIVTLADTHGNENFQVCWVDPELGWLYPITDSPKASHEFGYPFIGFGPHGYPISPDSRYVTYASNERTGIDYDIFVHDMETGERRSVYAEGGRTYPCYWSPDGRYIIAVQIVQHLDLHLFLIDVQEGTSRQLPQAEADVRQIPGPWHPDGSGFYMICDLGREFSNLAFYNIHTDEISWVHTPDWDVSNINVSQNGKYLAWLVNEDGWSRLYVQDLDSGEIRDYPQLPKGGYLDIEISPTEPLVALHIESPVAPLNTYVLRLDTGEYWTLTYNTPKGIRVDDLVMPETVRIQSFDGKEVSAYLYKPKGLQPGERAPIILSIHGGPEAQERPFYLYDGMYQYLLNRGIGVLAPNIRGSKGYGKSWQKAIYRDWGGGELKDLEHCARYMQNLDWVDTGRMGVFGGSFGGFASLSCATRLPEYWTVAVDSCGPADLLLFANATLPIWKKRIKGWVGDPVEDREMLIERSPITYLDNLRCPILVMQGAEDPRMPKVVSDQLVERLREMGREVEYIVQEDEGHGSSKSGNRLGELHAITRWLERYLLGEPAARAAEPELQPVGSS